MKSVLGAEYDTVVDAILSNWFITRNSGTPTQGVLRLYFARALTDFSVAAEDAVGYYGATQLISRYSKVFSPEEFTSVFNTVNNRTEYYIDVDVETDTPSDVEIPSKGAILPALSNLFLYRIEAPTQFTAGEAVEPSDEFIVRAKNAVSTRELITYRAIATVFGVEIPDASEVYVAGYGEPEMVRDIAEFGMLKLHYGNKADIYVHADFIREVKSCVVTNVGGVSLVQLHTVVENPVVHILSVKIGDSAVGYTIHQHSPTHWCSTRNFIVLRLASAVADGTIVGVTILVSEVAKRAQTLVDDFKQRVVCYDPLVKGKHAAVCTFSFNIRAASGADLSTLSSQIKSTCVSTLNSIQNTKDFSVSKLMTIIHTECWDVLAVRLNVVASYRIINPDTGLPVSFDINDTFALPSWVSAQVSENTVQLVTFEEEITISFN